VDEQRLREALRLSEERAELALDAAQAGVFDVDLMTGRVYGSARYRTILRLPDGPIDGRLVAEMIHPEDRAVAMEPWNLPDVGGRLTWNARVRPHGSNEWRLIETHARVLRDEEGRPARLIGVMHDVTDTVAQLDALRESERRLSEAQQVAGIGSWSWNPVTREIVWTEELYRIFDVERDGRAGPTFEEYLERIIPADRERLLASIDRALRDGTSYHFEHSVILRDGSLRRVRSHGGAQRDDHGRIVRLVGTAQDVTEQWMLSERVRLSEARYALAVEGTSDGIWTYDFLTRRTEVSPRLLELLGRAHENAWVSTEWVTTLMPAPDLELLRAAVSRHLTQNAPLDLEVQMSTESQGMRWFRLRGRAVRDASGVPVQLAGALSDVTEQRALQARLQHDSKMNALGTLAGGIAHDFNNLVAAMLGYAQLAADEIAASSPAHAHLSQVIDAARRSREIVREILAFSRSDVPRRSAVDLAQLTEETVRLMLTTRPEGVQLRVTGADVPRLVLGDPTQLQRIVLNLCTNSLDAVRSRGGDVEVRLANESFDAQAAGVRGLSPGHYVRLQVIDNGIGIAPDAIARVFDPFFTTKPVGEGTGLGLSVVHGLVAAAGGTVTVGSVEDEGTTVSVWLPRLDARTDARDRAPEVDAAVPQRRGRIVVVDDDPAVGRMLQVALSRANYDARLFSSAREALKALTVDGLDCDCIVTDLAMPELSGIEMLVALREAGIQAPALLVTGFANGLSPEVRERARVLSIMEKPIELRAFVEMIQVAVSTP
jgi:PAS domain S-box-containing protein